MSNSTDTFLDPLCSGLTSSVAKYDEDWPPQSDAAFHATPINHATAPKSFVQNEIALQRSSSKVLEQAAALGRVLSQRISRKPQVSEHVNNFTPDEDRHTSSRLVDTASSCNLVKSLSERSAKSVCSLHATGTFPIGTLRVHSPSPSRTSTSKNHEFLKFGDIIVTRGVNPGTIVGFDTATFTVQEKQPFEGLKNVPMGVHLIWSSANKDSFRQGFWIISSNRAQLDYGEVIVKRWDKNSKVLDEEVSAAEIMIQRRSTPEFVQDLAPYDKIKSDRNTKTLEKRPNIWAELTSCIRGSLLTKISGYGWNDWIVSSYQERKPATHHRLREHSLRTSKNGVLNFVFSQHHKRHRNVLGREQSAQIIDTSGHVQAITRANCDNNDPDEIIGELQFCYLTGTCLKNPTCIEHWAYIVKMGFQAFLMAIDEPKFFAKFIKAVHVQLIYDERDEGPSVFEHDDKFKTDFKNILTVFKSRLIAMLLKMGSNLTEDQNNVGKTFEDLESWLCRWDWDLRGNTGIEPKEPEAHPEN